MRAWLDGASISLSLACLLHCLALPIVIATLPAVGALLATPEWTHAALLAFAMPLSLWALVHGYNRHGRMLPVTVGIIGLFLMGVGIAFEAIRVAEIGFTVSGATLLAFAHLRNWRHLDAARAQHTSAGA